MADNTTTDHAATDEAQEGTTSQGQAHDSQDDMNDDAYDPEKGRKLIENLREDKAKLQAKRDALAKDLAAATKQVEALNAQLEDVTKQRDDYKQQAVVAHTDVAKAKALSGAGLDPDKYARFLTGDDEEQWKQDIADLLQAGEGTRQERVVDEAQVAQDQEADSREAAADMFFA